MCNETEMWLEIEDYDRRASLGTAHVRGKAHDPRTCLKCRNDERSARTDSKGTAKKNRTRRLPGKQKAK